MNQDALRQFAKYTLMVLESHEEWNADTLDAIADYAFASGLATTESGLFKVSDHENQNQDQNQDQDQDSNQTQD